MRFDVPRNLHEVERDIRRADLLLFRGHGWVSKLIATAGRSRYTHAAKVDRIGEQLFCCEVREWKGGRIVTLASQVRKYPGRIDVYTANPNNLPGFDREASAEYMRRFAGEDYGYRAVAKASLQYLPVVRLLARTDYEMENGDTPNAPPYCSQACASADRHGGGIDPVPNLADKFTLPGDLGRSGFYRYLCTLSGV